MNLSQLATCGTGPAELLHRQRAPMATRGLWGDNNAEQKSKAVMRALAKAPRHEENGHVGVQTGRGMRQRDGSRVKGDGSKEQTQEVGPDSGWLMKVLAVWWHSRAHQSTIRPLPAAHVQRSLETQIETDGGRVRMLRAHVGGAAGEVHSEEHSQTRVRNGSKSTAEAVWGGLDI